LVPVNANTCDPAMSDFLTLDSAIRRNTLLAATVCLALLLVCVASLVFAFESAGSARDLVRKMPVLVVPGAVGGVYSPGLSEDNVRATARYLASLATNFGGGSSFHDRFDELESFSSPQFLPALQRARAALQKDVETQNQSRAFFAATPTEFLQQAEPGLFDYRVTGERIVYASGLPMDSRQSQVHLRLRWGTPSRRNLAGIVLEGFEVRDIGEHAAYSAASSQG